MENAILYFYIFFPPLALVYFLASLDVTQKIAWRTLFAIFLGGTTLAILSMSASAWFQSQQTLSVTANLPTEILKYAILTPFGEEAVKVLALMIIWKTRKIRSIPEGILFGLSLGFGFAAAENLIFATKLIQQSGSLSAWYQIWFRGLHTPFLHGTATAIFGACLGYHAEKPVFYRRAVLPLAFLSALALHAFWNLFGLVVNSDTGGAQSSEWLMNGEIVILFGAIITVFFNSVLRKNQKVFLRLTLRAALGLVFMLSFVLGFQSLLLQKAQSSREYSSATNYLLKTPSVRNIVAFAPDGLLLQNVTAILKNQIPLTVMRFKIQDNPDLDAAEVSLIQVSDFWIVYASSFTNNLKEKTVLTSSYETLLNYFAGAAALDPNACEQAYFELKASLSDPVLLLYLQAKQDQLQKQYEKALPELEALQSKTNAALPTIQYEKAVVIHDMNLPLKAATMLEELIQNSDKKQVQSIALSDYPLNLTQKKHPDALTENFDTATILARSTALLAQIYYDQQDFTKGTWWAKEAVVRAEALSSRHLINNALYLKAINLHAAEDYKLADLVFDEILYDAENPNLTQKAWAYFYKSDIAIRENRHSDALNDLETAVNLDPRNATIRQEVVSYLIQRNYPNDLEIALGFALRGIDFGIEKDLFVNLASQLYQRLGIPDKTAGN